MGDYKKIIKLFEQIKEGLNPVELQCVLNQIEEYDSCHNSEESDRIEKGLIKFCEKKLKDNN
jgi:hypothetical protein